MCDTSNITVGTIVMVKVGRNEIEVVVTEITANGWKVKKVGSDRMRPIPRRNPADRRRKSSHS